MRFALIRFLSFPSHIFCRSRGAVSENSSSFLNRRLCTSRKTCIYKSPKCLCGRVQSMKKRPQWIEIFRNSASWYSINLSEARVKLNKFIRRFMRGFLVLYKLVRSTSEIKQIHKEVYERPRPCPRLVLRCNNI